MNRRIALLSIFAWATALILLSGCGKEEQVHSYSAPKDPQLITWTLPGGWRKAPFNSRLLYAAFAPDDALKVTVSYLFPNGPGARDLLMNVNRWRGQLGLEPVMAAEVGGLVKSVAQPGSTVQLVDMAGTSGQRMRAMIVPREDRIWFFKMTGPAEAVDGQKKAFDSFVKSVNFPTPAAAALTAGDAISPTAPIASPVAPAAPITPAAGEPGYTLPAGWTRIPNPSPMRVMTLGTGGDKPAQIIVSRLSSNFGGMGPNLTRWRGEVGLPPSNNESDLKETPIPVGTAPGLLIDLSGPGKSGGDPMRSLIARRAQGDSIWFFKILGPVETVTRQQTAFTEFLASLKLPGE